MLATKLRAQCNPSQGCASLEMDRQLDCAAQYVEQILRPVGGECTHAQRASETKKRKRQSPFLSSNGRDFMQQLSLPGTPTTDLLPLFNGELRHYQLQGIKWLYSMHTNGLASILADESAEDRMIQVAGLTSCMRSKGMCGPLLLVAPSSSQPDWCQHLQRSLGDGLSLHMLTDDSVASMHAMQTFCSSAVQMLAQHADTLTVPPSSMVITDPELLVKQQAKLAQLHIKVLILDTAAHAAGTEPASPCGSVAAPEPQAALERTVSLPPASRPTRLQGGQRAQHGIAAHHTRRHTLTLPSAAASNLRVKSMPLATRSKANASGGGHKQHDRAGPGRGHGRKPGGLGPMSGKCGGTTTGLKHSQDDMDEDPGHDQLVLSLSRLSSHGDANEEDTACGQIVEQNVPAGRMGTRARSNDQQSAGIQRASSGTSSQTGTGGVFAVQHLTRAASVSQACSRPPRPSTCGVPQPAPVLQSVGSWPSSMADTTSVAGNSRAASSFTAGSTEVAPGLGCVSGNTTQAAQLPPWLAFQQQLLLPQGRDKVAAVPNLLWMQGPVTRSRSSNISSQVGHATFPFDAMGQQQTGSPATCNLPAAGSGEQDEQGHVALEEGVVLPNAVRQAMRTVLHGAPGNVLLLAADAVPEAGCCEGELWPLLSLLLHTAAEPLQASVQRAAQAGLLTEGSERFKHVWAQLRALVHRFMLRRATDDTSLDTLRQRSGPECNLYDLFARTD